MKNIKLIICALLVCVSFVGVAEAKSRGGSFKSGFASQKRTAGKPVATYKAPVHEEKKTAFGSFGNADAKSQQTGANIPQSKMSKDLTDTRAQSNALKTVDARNKVSDTSNENGWFKSGNSHAATNNNANGQATSQPPKTFERRQSNQSNASGQSSDLLHGLMWFMLGNSLAQHATAANSPHAAQVTSHDENRENKQGSEQHVNGENNSMIAEGVVAQRGQEVPAEETETIFIKILRVLAWLIVISGIIWVVRRVGGLRNRNMKKPVNYSLGS